MEEQKWENSCIPAGEEYYIAKSYGLQALVSYDELRDESTLAEWYEQLIWI